MHAAVQSITIKVSEVDPALLNDADELQKLLRNVTELAGLHSL
nr:MAG TPA: S-adenosylmethionine decarboxylase [Caudoviricetes sp.]